MGIGGKSKKGKEKEKPLKNEEKLSLDDFSMSDFITEVDVEDMDFLNTAGG